MKRKILTAGVFLFVLVFQLEAQTETKTFRGKIGENQVQMTLERSGGKLIGTYFYQKIGKDLKVSGSVNEDGSFTLSETSPTGAKTGEFHGNWSKEEDDGYSLNGEWKNPQGTKSFEFYLMEQMIFFKNGEKLFTKSFAEKNKPKMFEITAEYPELTGVSPAVAAKFNLLAKNRVMKYVGEFRKDMLAQTAQDLKFARERGISNYAEITYNIEYADEKIISIWFGNSFYTGGAHPNSFSFTLNFDLKTGKELALADIFQPDSNYLKVISDYSITALKKEMSDFSDDDWIKEGAGPDPKNFDSWNITKKGLLITFDSYQVAAYVAGPQEVIIPYSELKSILKPNFALIN